VSSPQLVFRPPQIQGRVPHDPRLDGLRGFAAISVMLVHSWFDNRTAGASVSRPNEYFLSIHMSHVAVMLFFITSGYVIGLTNSGRYSAKAAWEYVRRRCLRIVPIYYVAIIAGWFAYKSTPSLVVLGNALFLQNQAWGIPPLPGDLPLWSLHYEVVYYAGFLLVWAFAPKVLPIAAAALFFASIDSFFGGPLAFLGGWGVGAMFWLAGLFLAWNRSRASGATTASVVSLMLLAYATNHLWPGVVLFRGLGIPYRGNAAFALTDLTLLPVTVMVFCAVMDLGFPGQRIVRWIAVAIPVGTALILQLMGRLWENAPWTMAGAAAIAALVLMPFNQVALGSWIFRIFRPLGKISYGIYLFHVPCVKFVSLVYPWASGWWNCAGAFACWFALTFLVSWICEAKLQQVILSMYKRRQGALPAR
jgi:peptidoglycan/LPS O-acetylase OafA/YrhL